MFTQDNIPKGLSFLKNIKNSVKQTPKTLSLKLYKKSFRGKGVTLFCNVGSDFLYLTERTHKPTAEGFAAFNSFKYKFSVKNGKLRIYQKKEILGRSSVRVAQMNFALSSQYTKRFAPIFKMWLEQNGLDFKKINKNDNFLPNVHYNEITYNVRRLCYPVLETITDKKYEFLKYCLYDPILTKYLRTHKVFKENQFLDYFFGYHGKKLKRLIYSRFDHSDSNNKYNVPIHLLSKGRLIKKLVSPETSIEFLSGQCVPSFTSWYSPLKFSRNFLSLLPDEQRNYLVARIKMQRDCHSLIDMSRAVNENPNTLDIIPKNRLLDIHEMETLVFGQERRRVSTYVPPDLNKPFEYEDKWVLPDNGKCGDFHIKIPQNRKDLMLWADDMHNCVHGYGSYIDNGGMVYGVFKEGKIKYNISVSQYGNLEQFYKACNMTPEPEDYSLIVRHLVNSGAVKSFPVG